MKCLKKSCTVSISRIILFLLYTCAETTAQATGSVKLKKLYQDLLRNYNPHVRPVQNDSEPIHIELNYKLQQVNKVDFEEGSLLTKYVIEIIWYDYQLEWNPQYYDDITEIPIPAHLVWLPDLTIYNEFYQNEKNIDESVMNSPPVRVQRSGRVSLTNIHLTKTQCSYDKSRFLFGVQYCTIKFGSWSHDGSLMDFHLRKQDPPNYNQYEIEHLVIINELENSDYTNDGVEFDIQNFVENPDWIVVELQSLRNERFYSCCAEPFVDVQILFKLKRRTGPIIATLVLPWIIFTYISLFTFLLQGESSIKMLYAVIYLLVLLITFASSTSFVDLSECYNFTTFIAILVLICNVIYMLIRKRSDSPPQFILNVIEKVSPYLMVDQPQSPRSSPASANIPTLEPTSTTMLCVDPDERKMSWKDTIQILEQFTFVVFSMAVTIGIAGILASGG